MVFRGRRAGGHDHHPDRAHRQERATVATQIGAMGREPAHRISTRGEPGRTPHTRNGADGLAASQGRMEWIVVHIMGESNFPVRRDDRYRHPIALGAPVMPGAQPNGSRGNVPKSTRLLAVAAAALIALTACTSNLADPGTSSTAAPSTSGAASTSVPATSVPVTSPSSSSLKPTPSVADPTTPNPWPDGLTPEQVADAQAAIEGYRQYWRLVDTAGAQPSSNWTDQFSLVATGPAKESILRTLSLLVDRQTRATGTTGVSPEAVDVQPGAVVISDCVDKTDTDLLDSAGKSVKAPDAPGTYFRHPASAQMVQTTDAHWVLAIKTDDWSQTC